MTDTPEGKPRRSRQDMRRNRQRPARRKHWSVPVGDEPEVLDAPDRESVRAKGDLSRKRTITDRSTAAETDAGRQVRGRVIAVRGQFVEVDDGTRIWPCSVRRILRTMRIEERSPVVVGDEVSISIIADRAGVLNEAVIEQVHPRRTVLRRSDGRKTHTIAANVDQALIITSIFEPMIKPHLIDRYLVAAHAGNLPAAICINKIDLDGEGQAEQFLELYRSIGYPTIATSIRTGEGLDALRAVMAGKVSLLAGQSGVGKSSLLNALQPGLDLDTAAVSTSNEKGRHTTTTARWLAMEFGGAAIDTPGIRALDVAMVPIHELEMHFVEFAEFIPHCHFPNCIHIREDGCAVKQAVEDGRIDPDRYGSYVQLFRERSQG